MFVSKRFNDRMFPELVKRDYIFVFELRDWGPGQPNQYRVTNKTNMLIRKFYNVLEGTEQI